MQNFSKYFKLDTVQSNQKLSPILVITDSTGNILFSLSDTQEEWLVDSIAFRIARKIWYVGRKPASLTDSEWQLITSKMRPKKGTFSKNERCYP